MPKFLLIVFSQLFLLTIWSTSCVAYYLPKWKLVPTNFYARVSVIWCVINLVLAIGGWVYLCFVVNAQDAGSLLQTQLTNYSIATWLDVFFIASASVVWMVGQSSSKKNMYVAIVRAMLVQSLVLLVLDGLTYYLLMEVTY